MGDILRSMAFYAVFYGGSTMHVTLAVLAMRFAPARVHPISDAWSRFHRWCVAHILGISIREEGVRARGPALYAIKHESFMEAIDLLTLLDHPGGFAKQELFAIPGWGRVAHAYGAIPVARGEGAKALRVMVKEARAFIADGRPLVIFPEGTRVPHGATAPLQSGFAALYKLLGLPVVPVAVDSGPIYQRRWKRPGTITYRFGEPIAPGLPREEIEALVQARINALNTLPEPAPTAPLQHGA